MINKLAASPWITKLLSRPQLIKQYRAKVPKVDFTIQDPAKRAAYSKYVKDKILKLPFGIQTLFRRSAASDDTDLYRHMIAQHSSLYNILDSFNISKDSNIMRRIQLAMLKKLKKSRAKYLGLSSKFDDLLLAHLELSRKHIPKLEEKYSISRNFWQGKNKKALVSADTNSKLQPDYSVNPLRTIWSNKRQSTLDKLSLGLPVLHSPWLFGSPHYLIAAGYHTGGKHINDGLILLKINPSLVNPLQVPFDRRTDGSIFTTPHLGALPGRSRYDALSLSRVQSGPIPLFDSLPTYLALFKLQRNPLLLDIPGVLIYTAKNNLYYKALRRIIERDKASAAYSNALPFIYK